MNIKKVLSVFSAACLMIASQVSLADGDAGVRPVNNKLYADECGSCHFAYQPEFLPASSWRKIMDTLDDHFGENAELSDADRDTLARYLEQNSGTGEGRGYAAKFVRSIRGDAPLRISELPYFKKEHREIPRRVLESKEVGSLSRCETCHRDAERGTYREGAIDIPGYGRWED